MKLKVVKSREVTGASAVRMPCCYFIPQFYFYSSPEPGMDRRGK